MMRYSADTIPESKMVKAGEAIEAYIDMVIPLMVPADEDESKWKKMLEAIDDARDLAKKLKNGKRKIFIDDDD